MLHRRTLRNKKTLLLLLAVCSSIYAQQYTYGTPDELKGIKKIFVDTGPDMKNHERIVSEIKKKLPDLAIVDDIEDAEVVLAFGAGSEKSLSGIVHNP